jgi:hypothetical protein
VKIRAASRSFRAEDSRFPLHAAPLVNGLLNLKAQVEAAVLTRSFTSSARVSRHFETDNSTTSSNFVGCSTGRPVE